MAGDSFWAVAAKTVILGIVPAILILTGIAKLIAMRRFIGRAERIRGRVIGMERERPGTTGSKSQQVGSYGRQAFRPEFEYTASDGQRRTARTPRATVAYNFKIGSEHEILVDARAPDIADIPGGALYLPGAFMTALGALLGLGGLYAFGAV